MRKIEVLCLIKRIRKSKKRKDLKINKEFR